MDSGPGPLVETPMMGDVVISVDTAAREAKEFGVSFEARVDRLLLHGILHLLGYDHEKGDADAETMEEEEERLVDLIREM
jgi:rRNA maturation RNase YbeY